MTRPAEEELRSALAQAEAALRRAQTHIGLLRQYDPEVASLVAAARQEANRVLGETSTYHSLRSPFGV